MRNDAGLASAKHALDRVNQIDAARDQST